MISFTDQYLLAIPGMAAYYMGLIEGARRTH